MCNKREFTIGDTRYLQSYETMVASIRFGQVTLDPMWCCSNTTHKHVFGFVGTHAKETRKHLKSGLYLMENLNG